MKSDTDAASQVVDALEDYIMAICDLDWISEKRKERVNDDREMLEITIRKLIFEEDQSET